MRAVVVITSLVLAWRLAAADPLLDALDTEDPRALTLAVAAIERAAPAPYLADTLFAAGRACEDRLHDPVRALAIYDRIVREMPTARVSAAAERRAERLRAAIGAGERIDEIWIEGARVWRGTRFYVAWRSVRKQCRRPRPVAYQHLGRKLA